MSPLQVDSSSMTSLEKQSVASEDAWPRLPWQLPNAEERWEDRKKEFTDDQKKHAWDKTADTVKTYSEEMVKRWNGEIDTLLVYAGLFSAILTAFIVQSYPLLTPDPSDPVLVTLQQISAQLNSFSVNPPFVNSTQPALSLEEVPPAPVPRWAVWLNALWFSSLIFSLSAASVGIMVKQWLNEYSSGLSGTSRQIARLRQYRLDKLARWRVAVIVAFLPVLLQAALVLFFAGLLVLLWQLDQAVAVVASTLIGILSVFTFGSAILPAFTTDCCYLSPLVYAIFDLVRPLRAALAVVRRMLSEGLDLVKPILPACAQRLVGFVRRWLWTSDDHHEFTWRGWELFQVAKSVQQLDAAMVTMAYSVTMDAGYLNEATICFTDLTPQDVIRCFEGIDAQNIRHWPVENQLFRAQMPTDIWSDVWLALVTTDMKDIGKLSWRCGDYLICSQLPVADAARCSYSAENLCSADGRLSAWLQDLIIRQGIPMSARAQQCFALVAERVLREHAEIQDYASFVDYHDALHMLLDCVVHSGRTSTRGAEGETAGAIRDLARHALVTLLERFHVSVEAWEGRWYVAWVGLNSVVTRLREHAHLDDLLSPALVDALARYLKEDPGQTLELSAVNKEWVRRRKRELDACGERPITPV
ncbi:hypothetical protein C8Q76DRAFT_802885 [Earliella scabrosa]|nr:hypothetical protein C8Q76DRAFT_802885 [Earliella scabrosa]